MIPRNLLSGVILAGGQARRMQEPGEQSGIDKGLMVLQGMPLVAYAQRFLAPQVGLLWISANRHLDVYAQYGTVIPDNPALGKDVGPLAGVATALMATTTPWLIAVPVDVPALPADLITRLAGAALETESKITYATTGLAHPLCMLVHRDCLESLLDYLRRGERKVRNWQQLNQSQAVFFEGGDDAFFNINTQEDLCIARRHASPAASS